MEQNPSWKANQFSSSQEIPHILWNLMVHYRIHKCLPPDHILSQINPVHTPISHFLKIHLNIILLSMPGSSKWSLSFRFLHLKPVCTSSLPYTCWSHPYLILLHFITQIVLDEEYRSFNSSLYISLQYPDTSFFLGPNILLSTLHWNTLRLCSSFNVWDQFSYPLQDNSQNYSSYYLNLYNFG